MSKPCWKGGEEIRVGDVYTTDYGLKHLHDPAYHYTIVEIIHGEGWRYQNWVGLTYTVRNIMLSKERTLIRRADGSKGKGEARSGFGRFVRALDT